MDSIKLLRLLQRAIDPAKCYVSGVFPREMANTANCSRFPGCFIANIDDSNQPGTHWVAFYARSRDEYEFFDSYGLTPYDYGFNSNLCSPSSFNSIALQSDLSNTCGNFCLYYLHSKSLGFAMPNIIRSFSFANLSWNDKLVRKFLAKISNSRSFYNYPLIDSHYIQTSLVKMFVKQCKN